MRRIILILMFVPLSCWPAPVTADPAEVLRSYVDAYNAHDVTQMLTYVSADVRWMSIVDGDVSVVTSGREELRDALLEYFENLPSTRSEMRDSTAVGDFVATAERATWASDGKTNSQCAIAVYELRDGLILNVWYFSEQVCDD